MYAAFLKIIRPAVAITAATIIVLFVAPGGLFAAAGDDHGLKATADAAGLSTSSNIPEIAGKIVGAGLSLLGIIFLGLMLYGGFTWMIARGDTKKVEDAKDTITHAVIGFAIVAGAYAITDFVISAIVSAT